MKNKNYISKLNYFSSLFKLQVFWVSIALILMILVFSIIADAFATRPNLFNVTRNFSFIANNGAWNVRSDYYCWY